MNIVLVQTEFLRDLLIRQIEPEQVQVQDSFAQRLVMMREDRVGQIIKVFVTGFAVVTLSFLVALMHPTAATRRI